MTQVVYSALFILLLSVVFILERRRRVRLLEPITDKIKSELPKMTQKVASMYEAKYGRPPSVHGLESKR